MSRLEPDFAEAFERAVAVPRDEQRRLQAALDKAARGALRRQEIAIARQFQGGGGWPYVVAAFACFAIWLSFFPLALLGWLNLPLAFVLSTVFAVGGYVTGHEAMHSNIARPGERGRWINEAVGAISTIPIAFPFNMARITHLEHHRHCNDPLRDPDYTDEAPNWWMAIYKSWYNRQPGVDGSIRHYMRILTGMDTPAARNAIRDTVLTQLAYMGVLFAMAWSGHAIEAALIWWLPRQIGLSYIRFFLSWAPHHPREGRTGRYENTRVFKSRLGHVLSICMETHIVHHLYPRIPNHRTRRAYLALKPVLEKRGVDCSAL